MADVLGLYWPAMAKTQQLIHSFAFTAIDYSTFNGSSDYFLAPNNFVVHPLIILYCIIFPLNHNSLEQMGMLQRIVAALHVFLMGYFSIKFVRSIF